LPTFQPIPINFVSCTLVTPPELTELEERELLEDDRTLDGTEELELITLELGDELETGQDAPPTTP
jgi:hypothetical protein